MTSRERVRRAVLFQGPDRIPYELPEPFGSDFLRVGIDPDPNWKPNRPGEDEWGCIWEKLESDKTMGQVKFHPLDDYEKLKYFRFPRYDISERYLTARKLIAENTDEKFVLAVVPCSFIYRLQNLRGLEQAYTDVYLFPEQLEQLLDMLTEIAIQAVKQFAELGVDGIFSCDDWGFQDRPILSPEMFQRYFKPRYQKVYTIAHRLNLLTFLHSCGYIIDLLDDFIDMGLDVIQMDQQENMGVETLAKRFGGRICFWCPVDIQKTMIEGSIDDVITYAKKLMREFGKFNGGFIAQWYASPEAAGHNWEKIQAMAETFIRYGTYPLKL
ncbi:MAG: hypothetical protein N3A72_01755 [bacterium]|nr:hypothetical protein [bacterium]